MVSARKEDSRLVVEGCPEGIPIEVGERGQAVSNGLFSVYWRI